MRTPHFYREILLLGRRLGIEASLAVELRRKGHETCSWLRKMRLKDPWAKHPLMTRNIAELTCRQHPQFQPHSEYVLLEG